MKRKLNQLSQIKLLAFSLLFVGQLKGKEYMLRIYFHMINAYKISYKSNIRIWLLVFLL